MDKIITDNSKVNKKLVKIIRDGFIFLNENSDMTEDEMKKHFKDVANKIGQFGATKEEAEKAYRVFTNCK